MMGALPVSVAFAPLSLGGDVVPVGHFRSSVSSLAPRGALRPPHAVWFSEKAVALVAPFAPWQELFVARSRPRVAAGGWSWWLVWGPVGCCHPGAMGAPIRHFVVAPSASFLSPPPVSLAMVGLAILVGPKLIAAVVESPRGDEVREVVKPICVASV